MKNKPTELLAPAGNAPCLRAAVGACADAVYLGLESFNARRGADNFTLDTLGDACDYAHVRDVLVYLTLNTLILPAEVGAATEMARQAYRRGVDGFIVQDVGIASELLRVIPEARIHASTQMNTHTVAGVEALHGLGFKRVTVARELGLPEVAGLSRAAAVYGMEAEAFVHGALCVCYSGQCLLSSMVGGRSANRGLCAQACRLPYSLHNVALRKTLASEGEHLLSPKDLCAIELVPELVLAGVASFKVEGRMKSPEYVSAVTSVYRAALDAALAEGPEGPGGGEGTHTAPTAAPAPAEEGRALLAEVFSRGFTTAYLEGRRDNAIMSYGRPNNRGVFIGRVTATEGRQAAIATEAALHVGDVLEFWTRKGHFAHTVSDADCPAHQEHQEQGSRSYSLSLSEPVSKGDRVFRVRNVQMAFSDDPFAPRVPVCGEVSLIEGEPLRLTLRAVRGGAAEPTKAVAVAEVEGAPVEAARTKPVEAAEVEEHIGRFGNTPFVLSQLQVTLGEGVGIGFSQLHKVRAQAADELHEALLAPYRARRLHRAEPREMLPPLGHRGCAVVAWAANPASARDSASSPRAPTSS
ncbi:MAG: U32 family peptidase, partial [Coriobacteriaceae bacterium]|nr:U32 family peptidase [Coriobacteriaceae bacterium]